jgi:tetratricopeptide (TPR) repeat protein
MVLSFFAIAPIQWQWVERCFPDVDEEELEDWRDEALLGLSLLQREGEGSYQLHPLVQQFLRQKLEGEEEKEEWARSFVGVMVEEAKRVEYNNLTVQLLETVAPAMPHVAEVATSWQEALSDEQLIEPFQRLGRFYDGQLDYLQAERWYEHCREVMKARLGGENPNYASSLNNLANFYNTQGRYSEAEPLYTEAIAIGRQSLPSDHPQLATHLNNLALLYSDQGRYSEAEPLYTEAIAIARRTLPPDHPDLATHLNNLANLYSNQGRYSEAEPLYTEAIAIARQSLPPDHPFLATGLNNLANLYRNQGRYSEAKPLYQEAIAIFKRSLPPEHPHIATVQEHYQKMQEMRNQTSEDA